MSVTALRDSGAAAAAQTVSRGLGPATAHRAVAPAAPSQAPPAATPEQPSAFAQLVRGLGHEVHRGETLVRGAVASAGAGDLSSAQLIVLQAGVYRYSEVIDLASRLVEQATGAVKTVVQAQ